MRCLSIRWICTHNAIFIFFLLSFIFLSFLSTTSSSSSDGSEFYSYSRPCVTNTTHNIQYINQSIHRFNEKLQAFNMLLSVFDFFFIIFSLQFIALIRFFFLPFHFVSLASNQTLFNNRQHTHTIWKNSYRSLDIHHLTIYVNSSLCCCRCYYFGMITIRRLFQTIYSMMR